MYLIQLHIAILHPGTGE